MLMYWTPTHFVYVDVLVLLLTQLQQHVPRLELHREDNHHSDPCYGRCTCEGSIRRCWNGCCSWERWLQVRIQLHLRPLQLQVRCTWGIWSRDNSSNIHMCICIFARSPHTPHNKKCMFVFVFCVLCLFSTSFWNKVAMSKITFGKFNFPIGFVAVSPSHGCFVVCLVGLVLSSVNMLYHKSLLIKY